MAGAAAAGTLRRFRSATQALCRAPFAAAGQPTSLSHPEVRFALPLGVNQRFVNLCGKQHWLLACLLAQRWRARKQLLAEGELVPGVSIAEFHDRRLRLASLLPPQSVAVVPSAAKTYRTGAIPYPYRQVVALVSATALPLPKLCFISSPSGAALTEPDACSAQTSFTSPVSRSRPLPCYRCPHRPPTHGTRFLCPIAARSASAGMALA